MFKYFYFIFALVIYILSIPFLIFKSKNPKYKEAIPAKFFLKNNPPLKENKLWFHSCSAGETVALKPILEYFKQDDINLTVITNTGFQKAQQFTSNVGYLPFEIFLPFWITKQKALVVMEAELWYMLFLVAKSKGTKTILINARISDKSYKSYKKFSFFYKQIFKYIDKIYSQSEEDKQRLQELGGKNIEVIGNIKLVNLPKITKQLTKPNKTIITAGSTHKTEEELILNAWDKSYGKLILVPRHPERFDEVYELVKSRYTNSDISFHRYSLQEDFNSDITIVDKMGELNNIYNISDVVILGGGFIKTAGGHNPIEPAFFNCKLISGDIIFNQKSLFECVNDYYLIKPEQLKSYLQDIKNLKQSSIGEKGDISKIIEELSNI